MATLDLYPSASRSRFGFRAAIRTWRGGKPHGSKLGAAYFETREEAEAKARSVALMVALNHHQPGTLSVTVH